MCNEIKCLECGTFNNIVEGTEYCSLCVKGVNVFKEVNMEGNDFIAQWWLENGSLVETVISKDDALENLVEWEFDETRQADFRNVGKRSKSFEMEREDISYKANWNDVVDYCECGEEVKGGFCAVCGQTVEKDVGIHEEAYNRFMGAISTGDQSECFRSTLLEEGWAPGLVRSEFGFVSMESLYSLEKAEEKRLKMEAEWLSGVVVKRNEVVKAKLDMGKVILDKYLEFVVADIKFEGMCKLINAATSEWMKKMEAEFGSSFVYSNLYIRNCPVSAEVLDGFRAVEKEIAYLTKLISMDIDVAFNESLLNKAKAEKAKFLSIVGLKQNAYVFKRFNQAFWAKRRALLSSRKEARFNSGLEKMNEFISVIGNMENLVDIKKYILSLPVEGAKSLLITSYAMRKRQNILPLRKEVFAILKYKVNSAA